MESHVKSPLKEFLAELPPPKQRRLRGYEITDRVIIMHKMVETPVGLFAVPTYYNAPTAPKIAIPEPKQPKGKRHRKQENRSFLDMNLRRNPTVQPFIAGISVSGPGVPGCTWSTPPYVLDNNRQLVVDAITSVLFLGCKY